MVYNLKGLVYIRAKLSEVDMLRIKIAGLPIAIDNRFEYIEHLARDYLTDDEPLFTVFASPEELRAEDEISEASFSDGYLESIVAYRKIAERLPEYDAFVLHGAVLNLDNEAYVFTARSGVGKTTHTRLWLEEFTDRVHYLNGDKPVIRFIDGVPFACGTPWRGKEGYGVNEMVPLSGIAFLERGNVNTAREIPMDSVVMKLISQIYMPKNGLSAILTMKLADRLIRSVRLVDLKCNMEREAARVSYLALKK